MFLERVSKEEFLLLVLEEINEISLKDTAPGVALKMVLALLS